jgi:hypothetical protein
MRSDQLQGKAVAFGEVWIAVPEEAQLSEVPRRSRKKDVNAVSVAGCAVNGVETGLAKLTMRVEV